MNALSRSGLTLVEGDLANLDELTTHVNQQDYIFHLAAIRGESKIPWETYYRVNVEATRKLVEASARFGVSKFIYVSSVGVHGTSPIQVPSDECAPYNPDSCYHRSKVLAEQFVLNAANSLNTVVIRPTVTYGQNDVGFLYRAAKIVKRGFFPVIGHGRNRVHLLYVKGLVEALARAMGSNKASRQIYLVADEAPIKMIELIQCIGTSLGRAVRLVNIPRGPFSKLTEIYDRLISPPIKGRSMAISFRLLSLPWYYSIKKAVNELGYHPYKTEEEVRDTIRWYVKNGWL
jgi:nucleoside-diphosphate-sugar epimerase